MVVTACDGGVRYMDFGGDGWPCILTVVAVTQIYACVKTHKPVYRQHCQKLILFITCKYKKQRSLIVLTPILFWSAKQNCEWLLILWFVLQLQKIPKCHLLAATGAVSFVWQSALSGLLPTEGNAEGQAAGERGGEGTSRGWRYSPCSRGIHNIVEKTNIKQR